MMKVGITDAAFDDEDEDEEENEALLIDAFNAVCVRGVIPRARSFDIYIHININININMDMGLGVSLSTYTSVVVSEWVQS